MSFIGDTLYKVLGIQEESSLEEIKFAYRRKLLLSHPDKVSASEIEHEISEVQEAYRILSDPIARLSYDQDLRLKRSKGVNAESINIKSLTQFDIGNDVAYQKECRCGDNFEV
jgi:diphthamide biosynthesis protein 4